jgi:hypothetical protein
VTLLAGQTIWVTSSATRFAAVCDACLSERRHQPEGWGYEQSAVVEGSIRADADVGFATCRRGHRLRVRRAAPRPTEHERSGTLLARMLSELADRAVAEG